MASVAEELSEPLGLVAGQGRYPLALARAAHDQGQPLSVVAIRGLTLPGVAQQARASLWLPLGHFERAVCFLKGTGVRQVLLAGAVPPLHQLLRVKADRLARSLVWRRLWLGDDGFLRALADVLSTFDLEVIPPGPLAEGLLTPEGRLAGPPLRGPQWALARRAMTLARRAGWQDRGQGAIVGAQGTLVEGRWGTDGLLRRSRRGWRGAILAKAAKPQQDGRFDLPTIGPTTIAAAARAGLAGVVVEAQATVLLDGQETISLAEQSGLSLLGWPKRSDSTAGPARATVERQTS